MSLVPYLAALCGCCLLTLVSTTTTTTTTTPSPHLVQSPWGRLSGVRMWTPVGAVDAYLGVPFALPPTGQRRWEKPQAHPGPGEGEVFEATAFQASCSQEVPSLLLYDESKVSEDCLYLNVFVPAEDEEKDKLRSVMVWIHGGGFFIGDAPVYQPYKLVSHGDVIVVTIQYRLGALGFLSTGDDTLPGNYGLWDQLMALKWVKDNIRSFGGDPDSITIFGESAGSMSVGLQAVSPKSKGLFRRVIMQSGSPIIIGEGRWVKDVKYLFNDLAAYYKCDSPDTVKVVECLRAVPAEVMANNELVTLAGFQLTNPFRVSFGPRVDGDFLPDEPARLVEDAEYVKRIGLDQVDVLVGFNNNEGALNIMAAAMLGGDGLSRVQSLQYTTMLLQNSLLYLTAGRHNPAAEQVIHFSYRGAKSFSTEPTDIKTLTEMYGDSFFYAPSIFWLRSLVLSQPAGKRFLYLLDHDFHFNRHTLTPGTHHGEELALEFDPSPLESSTYFKMQNKTYDDEDIPALSDIFVNVVTGFAKTGNPGQGLVSSLLESEWPEYRKDDEAYVAITTKPQVRHNVYEDRMALWLELLPLFVTQSKKGPADTTFRKEEL